MKIRSLNCSSLLKSCIASLVALGALSGCTVSDQNYPERTQNVNTDHTVLIKYQLKTHVYVDQETGCQYFGGPASGYTIRYDAAGVPMCRLTTP